MNGFVGAIKHLVREGSDWRIKDKNGSTSLIMGLRAATLDSVFRLNFVLVQLSKYKQR